MPEPCNFYSVRNRRELLDLAASVPVEQRGQVVAALRQLFTLGSLMPGAERLRGFSPEGYPSDYTVAIVDGRYLVWFREDRAECEIEVVMTLSTI